MPGEHYHKFDPSNAERLLSEERADLHPLDQVLALLDLRPGQTVTDVGCGPGYFTLPIARAVGPGGRVFALDIAPGMLDRLRQRLGEHGISNVDPLLSEESALPLADTSCDRVLAAFLLHELVDPAASLGEIRRVLRPQGSGVIVEWLPRESPMGPPLRVRVPPDRAAAWLRAAGFAPERAVAIGPYSYAIAFRR